LLAICFSWTFLAILRRVAASSLFKRMAKKGRAGKAPPPNQVTSVLGTRLSSD